MSLRINQNIEALTANRYLAQNDAMLSKSIEKLASGQKINSATDGPASLVISENLRSQISSLKEAAQNSEIAASVVQTAEGAMDEVSRLLVNIRQRAVAAANTGVNNELVVAASQSEIQNALSSIDRIAQNTQFGSKPLLNGTNSELEFQIGADKGNTIKLALPNITTDKLGIGSSDGGSSLAEVDVRTPSGAASAISIVDKAISEIASSRGELGALQRSALQSNLVSLRLDAENLSAAESIIRDADVAMELAEFTRLQIMNQFAVAQAAQANVLPRNLLHLVQSQS
ncbi:MAG: flagellin [SAR324 cluster bacterium]|nr:flagellin [SAR324 cluster bacterium]|tara:strand:- start:223 stop:1083 length:861 start_codon:yes stop_codon:yes gene_type:complete